MSNSKGNITVVKKTGIKSVTGRVAIKKRVLKKKKKSCKKDYSKLFNTIIVDIAENGKSVRAALQGKMSTQKFYELLEDESNAKRYARACEDRADKIADEILEIADDGSNENNTIVQRDRLRVDSRKWLLAKLHPKKYGDKIDVSSGGEKIGTPIIIFKDFTDEQP